MDTSRISDIKLKDILNQCLQYGTEIARQALGIKSATFEKYLRKIVERKLASKKLVDIVRLQDKLSDKEIVNLVKGVRPQLYKKPSYNFNGKTIKIGVTGDWHLGSIYTNSEDILKMFKWMEKEKCEFITHSGDLTEGMSNRPGHIYELTHIGYDAQKQHAIEILKECKLPIYFIDGNHDRWFVKSNGAIIVKDVCDTFPNTTFLGHDEGDIELAKNCILKLWHGEDGNSYATSYRLQKLVESITGGEKPSIILAGHTHKAAYIYERHIQVVSVGCMQKQSKWMRSKKLAAHTGFWIIEVTINKKGVARFKQEWFPLYI